MNPGQLVRTFSPLVLLVLAMLALFGKSFPGSAALEAQFGDGIVLRVCAAVLAVYVLVLWGEAQGQRLLLKNVLQEFQKYHEARAVELGKMSRRKADAARLLIAALASPDASIRQKSRHNLTLLTGQDLGDDPARWQQWLSEQELGGADGKA